MIYVVVTGIVALGIFFLLAPRYQVFVAFFIMTQCFDLLPRITAGIEIWDIGAVLLMIAAIRLVFMKPAINIRWPMHVAMFGTYLGWMAICVIWSILVYSYPVLDTLKSARHMVIGYASLFVILRLFAVDKDALQFFLKAIYVLTFVLLPVCIVQYIVNKQILFGLHTEYGSVTRYLPVFLPFIVLQIWFTLSRILAGERVAKHEPVYVLMAVVVVAITYTRGLYLAVAFGFIVMIATLIRDGHIRTRGLASVLMAILLGIVIAISTGAADRVLQRFGSAFSLVFNENADLAYEDMDTYSGRIALMNERFGLATKHNPLVGYGFIHEANVPKSLRDRLKYGSRVATPEYLEKYARGYPYVLSLHSVDIGWADIVIDTGLVGFSLLILAIAAFVVGHYSRKYRTRSREYFLRLALFLEVVVLAVLMFNGNAFAGLVQIPAFLIAGHVFCTNAIRREHAALQTRAVPR